MYILEKPRIFQEFNGKLDQSYYLEAGMVLSYYDNDRAIAAIGISLIENERSRPGFEYVHVDPVYLVEDRRKSRIFYNMIKITHKLATDMNVRQFTFVLIKENLEALSICRTLGCVPYALKDNEFYVVGKLPLKMFSKNSKLPKDFHIFWPEVVNEKEKQVRN